MDHEEHLGKTNAANVILVGTDSMHMVETVEPFSNDNTQDVTTDAEMFVEDDDTDDIGSNVPLVFSWGRSDYGTLLKSKDSVEIDGIVGYNVMNKVFLQIASNENHTACLTSTGDIYLSGSNEEGQVSTDYSETIVNKPRVYELGNHRITSIALGLYHTVCVTANGIALSFGGNDVGQLGHTPNKHTKGPCSKVDFPHSTKTPIVIQKVACGDFFTLFLTTSGEVYGCGSGQNIGQITDKDKCIAERIEGLVGSNIIDITTGSSHAFALSSDGELYAWGSNQYGQLGIESNTSNINSNSNNNDVTLIQTPKLVTLPNKASIGKVIGMSCGEHHSIIWTSSGVILGTGSNKYGQLGVNMPRINTFSILECVPVVTHKVNSMNNIHKNENDSESEYNTFTCHCIQVACGKNHTLVLTQDPKTHRNTVYGFGSNSCGQLIPSSTVSLYRIPVELTTFSTIWNVTQILYISAGGDQSFLVAAPKDTERVSIIMRRQFSTLASRSVSPMSTTEFLDILKDIPKQNKMVNNFALSTMVEIFSSSSLLAASFKNDKTLEQSLSSSSSSSILTSIDYDGLEECYVTLFKVLGESIIPKLIDAFKLVLTDLEAIHEQNKVMTNPPLTSTSTSSGPTISPMPPHTPTSPSSTHKTPVSAATTTTTTNNNAATNTTALSTTTTAMSNIPDSVLRTIIIVWLCPIQAEAILTRDIFPRLVKLICALPSLVRQKLIEMIQYIPPHLAVSRIIKPVQQHLSYVVKTATSHTADPTLPLYCVILNWIYSQVKNKNIIPLDQFYNETISALSDDILLQDFLGWKNYHILKNSGQLQLSSQQPFFISNHAFLLNVDAKRRILLSENIVYQQTAQQQAFTSGFLEHQTHGGTVYINPWFIITVDRNNLLQTALVHIAHAADHDLQKPLKVIFEGEEGIDAGGVTKEFFQLLIQQLFSLDYGMFQPTADGRSLWINKASIWNEQEFHLIGVLLGLAVYNGVLLDIHLPKIFYRKLLYRTTDLEDLASIDIELYKGLKTLLSYEPACDVESIFCRTFEVTWDLYGETQSYELIEGGKNISVTGDNRQLYVTHYVDWILNKSISNQFNALFKGFTRVINISSLLLLNPEELELLMVGQPHLDFHELEASTVYIGSGATDDTWNAQHETIKAFWHVIHNLPFEDKQKFLLFVTGSSKAPVGGLAKLGLKIQRMGPDSNQLPTSHTCFNTLLLPEYSSEEKLKDRLEKAISECEGFGLK